MDLGSIPLFKAMAKRMAWLGERQQVLAQNVANADTPGYLSQDLKPLSFRELVGGASARAKLATTQPMHLAGVPAGRQHGKAEKDKVAERTISGNGVSIEDQMMKVSDTANEFSLASSLYKRHLAMMRAALGRAQG
jgi:flagellar basal-body rod protein FlgB